MSKSQKRCVFCGGTPATKSHIWPDWLDSLPLDKATHHEVHVGKLETFVSAAEGPSPQTQVRQGRAGARKPRNVCLACNGGWMSRIEQLTKPTLSALILGSPILLRPADQWWLASLITLITIRMEFTAPQMQAVPVADRQTLMVTGAAPLHSWKIWIAQFADPQSDDFWTGHLGMQLVSSPAEVFRPHKCNAQVTTMVIGKFIAHVASSSVMSIPDGYSGIGLAKIWPTGQFDISSTSLPTLNRVEAIHLHESWAASLKPVPR
ncbi:hypothetical protein [Bradyrhizobium sp. McL0616]|uniref:hypothetical protein n=1 Tax=Bradyrhizobium sp. McL0616 TaxID=3415674 RepID=UPI003CE67C7F